MNISEMAAEISAARKSGTQTQIAWPDPAPSRDDAMRIQAVVFEQFGSPSVGWKVGATTRGAQNAFGIDSPFFGPVAAAGVLESGASLAKTPNIGACEPEYAFKLARDFPASGEDLTVENVAGAVQAVHIAVEVIGRCVGNPDFANGVGVTLDFAGNAAFVIGPEIKDWQVRDLANTVVYSKVDGEIVETGNGLPVMGDPVNSVIWLAQQLTARGIHLKAGDWVSTGTCTAAVPAVADTTYTATFGNFGDVSISFT